ncbi:MAG: hypothetical protein K6E21_00895 [Bacilli bacterium]|nr:hypothetical protein [Bacilli bacterium]
MNYTKIRLDFKYGPKGRFYRVILVKGNPDLFKFAIMLGTSVEAAFEHCFLITTSDKKSYVQAGFMEEPFDGYKHLGNYKLYDLPEKFCFEYDTGDGWNFDCKRYKKLVEVESNKDIILLEGAGQGIWEDNITTLYALFNGEIDKDFNKEDYDKGICKPWNLAIDKYSDFDLPIDIEEANKILDDEFNANYKSILKSEKEFIKETKVCLKDYNESDTFNRRLNVAILGAVDEQVKNLSYVKDAFKKLSNQLGANKARECIASELLICIYNSQKNNVAFDEKDYKKRLNKLVQKSLDA